MKALSGKKTYIVAGLVGVAALVHAIGLIDNPTYLTLLGLLNGAGLSSLRDGVAKSGPIT